MFRKWNELPEFMRVPEVRPYYEVLKRKKIQMFMKRIFDIVVALLLLIFLAIPMIIIAICIKVDSEGPVLFRQKRVTTYGKVFRIHKFRTMVVDADKKGSGVTVEGDMRITKIGHILRRYRIDEVPQLFDVLCGDMSFVGTRPESEKYVKLYRCEYFATLLLPAGITSETSIRYKNEDFLLKDAIDVDQVYIEKILPEKMKSNLKSIRDFSLINDFVIMIKTVVAVLGKEE